MALNTCYMCLLISFDPKAYECFPFTSLRVVNFSSEHLASVIGEAQVKNKVNNHWKLETDRKC